jgi:hypothetical protein
MLIAVRNSSATAQHAATHAVPHQHVEAEETAPYSSMQHSHLMCRRNRVNAALLVSPFLLDCLRLHSRLYRRRSSTQRRQQVWRTRRETVQTKGARAGELHVMLDAAGYTLSK